MTFRRPLVVVAVLALAVAVAVAPAATAAEPAPAPLHIHDVHGATRLSPYAGQVVSGLPGVVTTVRAFGSSRGFWFQDPTPDADPATSEGLFVFTRSATPAVAVGDAVQVSGTVAEFYPGGSPASTPQQSSRRSSTRSATRWTGTNPARACD